jgi:DNA-binding NtrC family response regulator
LLRGKGTTFDVFLPECKGEEPPLELEGESAAWSGTERVLFIDDEEPLRDVGKMMLESLGYQVTAAQTPAEALELFEAEPSAFDLVMTDMTMPGMTGDLLARKIMEIREGIPVILCTGYSERMSPEKAQLMGIREFIMKPLELKALSRIMRRALDKG